METNWELEQAMQAVCDFRRDVSRTPQEKLDLGALEKRIQEVVHAVGRELVR
jgi:hypothetical protein